MCPEERTGKGRGGRLQGLAPGKVGVGAQSSRLATAGCGHPRGPVPSQSRGRPSLQPRQELSWGQGSF